MNKLVIHVDSTAANYPVVRLWVDGKQVFDASGFDLGNDPADILDTGALLPTDPPRRIAFYGCGCGEFGCAAATGVIERCGDQVVWRDFCSPTGLYNAALPEPEDGPDPVATGDADDLFLNPVDLPTFVFAADDYLRVVGAAMRDRSWETRSRAVIREMKALRPDWTHWATRQGDAITIHHRGDGGAWSTDVDVPAGPVRRLAATLVDLLDAGVDPRRIRSEGLWR